MKHTPQTRDAVTAILRDYMAYKKIDQTQFAKMVGCSGSNLCRWLQGTPVPPPAACRIEAATKGKINAVDLIFARSK